MRKATKSTTEVTRLMVMTSALSRAGSMFPERDVKNAAGMRSPNPATKRSPLPTSLMAGSKSCSFLPSPPKKKQAPRHRSKFARTEPSIADRITGMRLSEALLLWRRTMNSTISTIPPRNVSRMTPACLSAVKLKIRGRRSVRTYDLGNLPRQLLTSKAH